MTLLYLSLFCLLFGSVIGYRLFPVIKNWRHQYRRRMFKPVLLQRYQLNKSSTDHSST